MGVERAVTRWYVQRQTILNEIVQLETQLTHASAPNSTDETVQAVQAETAEKDSANIGELQQQLTRTRAKLQALGPCPKPMMG